MIDFIYPELALSLFLPCLILFFYLFSSKKRFAGVFSEEVYKKLSFEESSFFGRNARITVLFTALALMALALARPVIDRGEKEVVSKGNEIVIGLDISLSMDAKDIYPSRLEASVGKIKELLGEAKNDKLAIVAFASDSYVISPVTKDKKIIEYLLENMDIARFGDRRSNMPAVIEAAKMLSSLEDRVLLLLSDGDEGDLKEIREEAMKNNIRIYAIGMAAAEGVPVPDGKGGYINNSEGDIVISKLNPALENLALSTGGAYTGHTVSCEDIIALYNQIKSDTESGEFEKEKIHDYQELFYFPLALALALLLAAFHSFPSRGAAVLLLALFFHSDAVSASFDFEEMQNAKKEYKEGRYEDALKSYGSIKGLDKDSEARRLYNTGNAHYMLEDFDKAIESYEKSLELLDDEDARHNLEMAKKRKEEKNRENKEQKEDERKKKEEDDSQKDGGEQKSDEQKEQNDKKEKSKKESSEKKEAKESEEQAERKEMSDQEEKRWLKELDKKPNPMPLKSIPVTKGEKNAKNW